MIRTPTLQDAPRIAVVHHASWHAAYADLLPAATNDRKTPEHFAEKWQQILSSETGSTLAIHEDPDGELTGFVSVGKDRRSEEEVGEIWAIYVHPDHFGAGSGEELWREGLSLLRNLGYSEANVRVEKLNMRARRFYEKRGFSLDPDGVLTVDCECENEVVHRGPI
jgi:ribosomal protein S18 acetylase RimI-like enzyme